MSECPGRLSQLPVGGLLCFFLGHPRKKKTVSKELQGTIRVHLEDEWFSPSSLRGQRRSKKSHPQAAVNFRFLLKKTAGPKPRRKAVGWTALFRSV
ncbi:MAG: hypothetical protein Q9M23_08345, partial [Mariprofundaceae bacterium]|nr:hypothetical protein [Mariprofundaceae bacterium]